MAQLDVRCKVLHATGPWGALRPAAGVDVQLVDRDIGNTDDVIWSGRTDAAGEFAGRTGEWRDTRAVTVNTPTGPVTTRVADPADLMLLEARLGQLQERSHANQVVRSVDRAMAVAVAGGGQVLGVDASAWAGVRASVLAFAGEFEATLRHVVSASDNALQRRMAPVLDAVLRELVPAVAAALLAVATTAAAGVGPGAYLSAAVGTALVVAVATIIRNLPSLLSALGLHGAAGWLDANLVQSSWFSLTFAIVVTVCALIMMMAASPADGWRWFVEQVAGADGTPGMRFVFER